MPLRKIDLNLLLALDALLATRNVTAAAARMHVTQPSMSGSLARLREHFSDPLLVTKGRQFELSPLGQQLVAPVQEALAKIDTAVSLRPEFDPARSKRHFSIFASETTIHGLLADVLQEIDRAAPGISVELLPTDPNRMPDRLDRGELDFIFVGENLRVPMHPAQRVMQDEFVCIVWTGNKKVKNKLSLEQYLSLGHAITRYGLEKRPGFEQYNLERLGVKRRVAITCSTPALLAPLVVGTQRIATMPSRLANLQKQYLPIKLLKPPIDLPCLDVQMQWNQSRTNESASVWFRELVIKRAQSLGYID